MWKPTILMRGGGVIGFRVEGGYRDFVFWAVWGEGSLSFTWGSLRLSGTMWGAILLCRTVQ